MCSTVGALVRVAIGLSFDVYDPVVRGEKHVINACDALLINLLLLWVGFNYTVKAHLMSCFDGMSCV